MPSHNPQARSTVHGNRKPQTSAGSVGQAGGGRENGNGSTPTARSQKRGGDDAGGQGAGVGVGDDTDHKELMHVLESTLITWTKQIKNVLKQVRKREPREDHVLICQTKRAHESNVCQLPLTWAEEFGEVGDCAFGTRP